MLRRFSGSVSSQISQYQSCKVKSCGIVGNHCSEPRQWQQLEIDLLKQLQRIAIAIQSTLFEQAQTELAERKRAEEKLREQAALLDVHRRYFRSRSREQNLFWNKGAEHLHGRKKPKARMPTSFL